MKKYINKLFGVIGLRLVRVPRKEEVEQTKNKEVLGQAIEKYGWLKKYSIDKVVDIGANDGHFAYHSSLVFDQADYFCFEPIPTVFTALQSRFRARDKFKLFNFGLGEEEKSENINVNEFSPSSSILEMADLHKEAFTFTQKSNPQTINIRPLDSFKDMIRPNANTLVKIDVQGYEMHVIKGGKKFLEKAGLIIIEMSFEVLYKDQPLFHEVYMALKELGYAYHGNIEQLNNPANHAILQADCLFIRDDNSE